MDAAEREGLRVLAKAAIDRHSVPWSVDPVDSRVLCADGWQAALCDGFAVAGWIAAADPQTVLALLDALDAAEERERSLQRSLKALGVALGALWESAGHGDTIEAEMARHAIERVNVALGITVASVDGATE